MAGKKIANKSWRRRHAKLAEQAARVQGFTTTRSSTSPTTRVQGSKSTEQDPKRCAIYTRTSTTRVQGSSKLHQVNQVAKALATKDIITTINDNTSGMLPDHRQQRLVDIITSGKFQTVFVESTHVLSRKARAADAVATIATKHGVQLITGDSPTDVPVSPGGKAMMAAVLQFQRDRTHKHMTHQLEAMI